MTTWNELQERLLATAPATRTLGRRTVADHYGDPEAEYRAIDASGGLCDRADRTVLRITGRDRAAWLHNLTTNQVKTLAPGQWRFAFVLNIKGRILFDLNLLADEECIWLDLDDRFLTTALTHFNKYTIIEDVKVEDVSDRFVRFTILGDVGVVALSEPPGLPRRSSAAVTATDLSWTKISLDAQSMFVWQDPAWQGQAADLIAPIESAADLWSGLTSGTPHSALRTPHSLTPIGWSALETLRIEQGIPASVSELNEEALPAETGQLDRAVSFNKGCYLGQEVVERMRADKSLARKLVGIVFAERDDTLRGTGILPVKASAGSPCHDASQPQLCLPTPILLDAKPAGTLTSVCNSPTLNRTIGLGYVRAAHATPGTQVQIADQNATLSALPFQV